MKKSRLVVIFLCLALTLALTPGAQAQEGEQKVVRVDGEGVVETAPDQAEVLLAVITEAADARQAQADNAAATNSLLKALKNWGIPDENISTQGYHVSPKYTQPPKPAPEPLVKNKTPNIAGYTVNHQLSVTVKDLEKLGELLDLAVKNGANQVTGVKFSISDPLTLKKQALRQAVQQARLKAEVLAAALGKSLGSVVSASGSWQDDGYHPLYFKEMAGTGGGAAPTPVIPGKIQIRAHANIVYAID